MTHIQTVSPRCRVLWLCLFRVTAAFCPTEYVINTNGFWLAFDVFYTVWDYWRTLSCYTSQPSCCFAEWFRHNVFIVPSIRVREQFWTRFISQNKSKFKKRNKINVHHSHVRRVASQIHCGDERRFYCVKLAYVVLFFGRTRFRWRMSVFVSRLVLPWLIEHLALKSVALH